MPTFTQPRGSLAELGEQWAYWSNQPKYNNNPELFIADYNRNHGTKYTTGSIAAGSKAYYAAKKSGTTAPATTTPTVPKIAPLPKAPTPVLGLTTGARGAPQPPATAPRAVKPGSQLQSAQAELRRFFAAHGIAGTMATWAFQELRNGRTIGEIRTLAEDRAEWKARFAANEQRIRRGLLPLSPEAYMTRETQYIQLMRTFGAPRYLYDRLNDLITLIAHDVSPAELQTRLEFGIQRVNSTRPEVKQALNDLYGIASGDILAYTLAPGRALEEIERRFRAAEVQAGARIAGVTDTTQARIERISQLGVSLQQSVEGFSQISQEQMRAPTRILASETFSTELLEQAIFARDPEAITRLQRLHAASRAGVEARGSFLTSGSGVGGLSRAQ